MNHEITPGGFALHVRQWCAWAPGLTTLEDWHRWAAHPSLQSDPTPDVTFLPPMFRRRCSLLTKIALSLVHRLLAVRDTSIPLGSPIFASRYGEIETTISLLQQLVQKDDLSPTGFSLSVHNTAAGQYSIIQKDRSPTLSLAAGPATLCYALHEAHALLLEDANREILIVLAEEALPTQCHDFADTPQLPHGIGLIVGSSEGTRIVISREKRSAVKRERTTPAPLDILPLLLAGEGVLELPDGRHTWRVER